MKNVPLNQKIIRIFLTILLDIIVVLYVLLKDLLKKLQIKYVYHHVQLWKDIRDYVSLIMMEIDHLMFRIWLC